MTDSVFLIRPYFSYTDNQDYPLIVGRVPFSPDRVMEIESDPDNPSRDIPDEYACLPIDGKESYRKYMEEMKTKHINPRRTW